MIVLVSEVPDNVGSVVVFVGAEEETGDTVRFGVDLRMADGLVHEILLSGEVACQVEGWQILGRIPAAQV